MALYRLEIIIKQSMSKLETENVQEESCEAASDSARSSGSSRALSRSLDATYPLQASLRHRSLSPGRRAGGFYKSPYTGTRFPLDSAWDEDVSPTCSQDDISWPRRVNHYGSITSDDFKSHDIHSRRASSSSTATYKDEYGGKESKIGRAHV